MKALVGKNVIMNSAESKGFGRRDDVGATGSAATSPAVEPFGGNNGNASIFVAEMAVVAQAVMIVDTGHTHYNELLDDGRVVYGATRSTGQIEKGRSRSGYSLVTAHGRVPSWRFQELGGEWPVVQIVAPADLRMVTRPPDPQQVPRPGEVEIVAKVFGRGAAPVTMTVDGGAAVPLTAVAGTALWRATASLATGLHRLGVVAGAGRDTIRVLVRPVDDIPRRGVPVAPWGDIHSLGAWPEHGIEGTPLGPNKNGGHR